ncbi:MAG: MutS-related protein [Flavisolibacter sp.]
MQEPSPGLVYRQQIEKYQVLLRQLQKKRSRLGWTRLLVFVLTALTAYILFTHVGLIGLVALVAGLALLLYLVSMDVGNNQAMGHTRTLIRLNEEELAILDHDFQERFDGSAFLPSSHDYAQDLDLFGRASLYQWLHRCYTEQGRALLATNLLNALSPLAIEERHEATRELSGQIERRQQWQAFTMQTTITAATEKKTQQWLEGNEEHFRSKGWKIGVQVYSLIALGSVLAVLTGYLSTTVFSALYLFYLVLSLLLSRNTLASYIHLSGIVKEVGALHQLVLWFEEGSFQSALLRRWQEEIGSGEAKAASQIRELKTILDRFDLRLSIVGVFLFNPFLLWDLRQMIALNEWRKKNRLLLPKWFGMIAEMEVLHTLATLHVNQPSWVFPRLTAEPFVFRARSIGHPLIPAGLRVDNDFDLEGLARIALVTGSNMAGKSTFLRSLGVNTVLAQMGAAVCARELLLSPIRLMSSMRIADNLAENTSTFYAELKKLKTIIEAVNRHEPLLILLDEILRGTNSLDRHKGSEALIAQLVRQKAVAVMATHDVELAGLSRTYPTSLENYHFDVQVEGEELYFDYRLKKGVCTSLNASILMKKIGIELS